MNHFLSRTRALLAVSLLAAAASVNAGSLVILNAGHNSGSSGASSSSTNDAGAFIPMRQAQRMFIFNSYRNWQAQDGRMLVCPLQFYADGDYKNPKCFHKDDKTQVSQWISHDALTLPGYEASGMSLLLNYRGDRSLIMYFRKKD